MSVRYGDVMGDVNCKCDSFCKIILRETYKVPLLPPVMQYSF